MSSLKDRGICGERGKGGSVRDLSGEGEGGGVAPAVLKAGNGRRGRSASGGGGRWGARGLGGSWGARRRSGARVRAKMVEILPINH